MRMHCQYCGTLLPEQKRRHARYCGVRCRVAAHRARDPGQPSHLRLKMLHLCVKEVAREAKATRGRRLVHGPLAGDAQEYFWGIALRGIELLDNAAQRDPVAVAKEGKLLLRVLQEIRRRRALPFPFVIGGNRKPVSDPTTEERP